MPHSERYSLVYLLCDSVTRHQQVEALERLGIPSLNVGYELSRKLETSRNHKFIALLVAQYFQGLMEQSIVPTSFGKKRIVALYNLGILFEPMLQLKPDSILQEFAKTATVIILWEDVVDDTGMMHFGENSANLLLDFSNSGLRQVEISNEV